MGGFGQGMNNLMAGLMGPSDPSGASTQGPQTGQMPPIPQGAPPMPGQETQVPLQFPGITPQSQGDNTYQDILNELKNVGQTTPAEKEFQRVSARTPQLRAEELYNQMFGITKTPQFDPTNRDPNQQPIGTKTSIDWKRFVPQVLSEMGRAFVQKGDYVPAKQRFAQQALQEYNAELGPVTKEVMYDNQNRRAAYRDAVSLVNNHATNQVREQANQIKQQVADSADALGPFKAMWYKDRALKAEAEMDPIRKKSMLMDIQADLSREKVKLTNAQTEGVKQTTQNNKATMGMKGPEGEDNLIQYYRTMGNNDLADKLEAERTKRLQQTQGAKDISVQQDQNGNFIRLDKKTGNILQPGQIVGNATAGIQGQGGPNGGDNNVGTTNGIPNNPPPPPAEARALADYYRGSAVNLGSTLKFKDALPNGVDPTTASIIYHTPIVKKLDSATQKTVEAAMGGMDNADKMYTLLKRMDPKELGTLKGNWNDLISGHTTDAQPDLVAFASTAKVLGNNHAATTGIRASKFIDDIGKELGSLSTNKAALAAKINAYENSFIERLSRHPEFKSNAGTKDWSAQKVTRAFHPDLYSKVYGKEVGPPDMNAVSADDIRKRLGGK